MSEYFPTDTMKDVMRRSRDIHAMADFLAREKHIALEAAISIVGIALNDLASDSGNDWRADIANAIDELRKKLT